jgi:hypothetical protein
MGKSLVYFLVMPHATRATCKYQKNDVRKKISAMIVYIFS